MNKAKKDNPKITRQEIEAQLKTSKDSIFKEKGEDYRKQVIESHGHFYRLMMKEITVNLKELKQRFPNYDGRGYELAGFVWFQGWNDMYGPFPQQYAKNMENLIRDAVTYTEHAR